MSSRRAWSALLLLAAVPLGFAVGGWVGARLLVTENAGLVGAATVFWCGVFGAGMTLLLSGIAIRWRGARGVRGPALVSTALAVALLVAAWMTFQQQLRDRDAARRESMARLPPFELVLAGKIAVARGENLTRFFYRSADNAWRIERADGRICQGDLPTGRAGDRSRVELLAALRGLDAAGVLVDPPKCQTFGEVLVTLDMEIRETKPPSTNGQLRLTPACRDEIPEMEALLDRVRSVYRRHARSLDCR